MISPLFKVRDYAIKDVNTFDIKVSWKTDAGDAVKCVTHVPCTHASAFLEWRRPRCERL